LETYNQAIRVVARSGFPQATALANERAGLFAKRSGCDNTTWWSQVYLRKARDTYAEWGAQVKVRELEMEFAGDWITADNREVHRSSNIKGRERFDPKNSEVHHSDDVFYLSGGTVCLDNLNCCES
jgi:hypothetical protein